MRYNRMVIVSGLLKAAASIGVGAGIGYLGGKVIEKLSEE